MLHRLVFIVSHFLLKPRVLWVYFLLQRAERKTKDDLVVEQKKALIKYLNFCREEVPYYRDKIPVIKEGCSMSELQVLIDNIPLLEKADIVNSRLDIELPAKRRRGFKIGRTGGSTGDPLKYRISNRCADTSLAILYRGLGRGGYRLGDKLAVMAGGSLVSKNKSLRSKVSSFFMNTKKFSSYGVSDELFRQYYQEIKQWAPPYIRGYASSLYEFAKFVERNELELSFVSVFTTAEMLFDYQRVHIEKVFGAKVYDGYGLNDGGVTAFECKLGSGYHIDMERAYLEVVDEDGRYVCDKVGRIVATSFLNYATPFVRYLTGDLAILSSRGCACGSPYPLLAELKGRTTDVLKINGVTVGSPVLTVLMGAVSNVARYQFIQVGERRLLLVIELRDPKVSFDEAFVRDSLFSNVGIFDLEFVYDDAFFEVVDGGKHKVVVNKLA